MEELPPLTDDGDIDVTAIKDDLELHKFRPFRLDGEHVFEFHGTTFKNAEVSRVGSDKRSEDQTIPLLELWMKAHNGELEFGKLKTTFDPE